MLEILGLLFAFFVGLVAPTLALLAFLRTRRLQALEGELEDLRRRIGRLEQGGVPAPAAEAQRRRIEPEPRLPVRESATSASLPTAPAVPPPLPPAFGGARERAAVERAPRARIEWERWIGVRGAALLSGIAIAVAGIFFYRHAVEQGWITPTARVLAGLVAGLVALAGAELLRRKRFAFAPSALAGAGVVLLYASSWAAHRLYHMLPLGGALAVLSAVTAACAWLSVRHASQLVALIGLLGGFATPLLIESAAPSPIGLFGYVLLLDLGLVLIAQRMRWPLLGLLAVAGTAAIELLWFHRHLDEDALPVTLVALGLLALALLALPARGASSGQRAWWPTQIAAVLVPYFFALEIAARAELGRELFPLVLLALVLQLGAAWVAARQRIPWLAPASAVLGLALVSSWLQRTPLGAREAWEFAACAGALALAALVASLWWGRRERAEGGPRIGSLSLAAALAPGGLLLISCSIASSRPELPLAPMVSATLVLGALLHAAGRAPGLALARTLSGGAMGLCIALLLAASGARPQPWQVGAVLIGGALLLQLAAHFEPGAPSPAARRHAFHAGALFALPALLILPMNAVTRAAGLPWALLATLLLALSCAASASALRAGGWLVCGVLFAAQAQSQCVSAYAEQPLAGGLLALLLLSASALLFLLWPLLSRARLAASPSAWRAAALAPIAWLPSSIALFHRLAGEHGIALFLAGFALASVLVLRAQRRSSSDAGGAQPARRTALVWLAGSSAFVLSLGLALEVGQHELRTHMALYGALAMLLWRRVDHAGLLGSSLVALGLCAGSLFANFVTPAAYPRSATVLWNWTSYAHALPVAALVLAAVVLRPLELQRSRGLFARLHRSHKPSLSNLCGLAAALALFAWINLALFDHFGEGEWIVIDLAQNERRDLALSLAWILYGLGLLALGMARRLGGLRWLSLAFLVLALGKVFLHDLAGLEGLYRVVSLLGLGLSLLLVSLLYQRFVFPRPTGRPASEGS